MDRVIQDALRVAKSIAPSAAGLQGMADGGIPRRATRARTSRGVTLTSTQPTAPVDAEHPAWIPTRLVTSKRATFNPDDRHIVDMDALRATPDMYEHNIGLVRSYPNVTRRQARMSTDNLSEAFIEHVKDNLLALHDAVPEHVRARSQLWYDGARKITDQWSKKYRLPDYAIAGVLAALSPQKDWYQNVSLAKRLLEAMRGSGGNAYHGFAATPEMMDRLMQIPALAKDVMLPLHDMIRNKSLGDIDRLDLTPKAKARAKAFWIRLHDETYNDKAHRIVTPEGGFGDFVKTAKGENAGIGWGSLGEIAKAIRAIEATDPRELSGLMGERHKVRNFYNNILAPNSPNGDVTIDTHAVAAGLYRPLSGNSLEVSHNFNNYPGKGLPAAKGSDITGIQGLYPVYAEAYRRAANERGILPRQMQSITWEAVRGLFPDTFKTKANNQRVNEVWNQYRAGKIDQPEARRQIDEIAGGVRNPTWFVEGDRGPNAQAGHPSDAGELPDGGVLRQPPESPDGRARGGIAPRPSQKGSRPEGLMRLHPAISIPGVHIRTAEAGNPIFRGDK